MIIGLIVAYVILGVITAIVISANLDLSYDDGDIVTAFSGMIFWPVAWAYAVFWYFGVVIIWSGQKLRRRL